jgi:F-box/leucine-rich repeat protein 2/20
MADLHEAVAGVQPSPVGDEQVPTQPEMPIKGKGRQRLLRGFQRISSSQSLSGLRRTRSVGDPYRIKTRGTLSCVNLAAAGPPQTAYGTEATTTPLQSPSPYAFPSSSSAAQSTTTTEFPFYDTSEEQRAARKIENGTGASTPTIAVLPSDLRTGRVEGKVRSRAASSPTQQRFSHFWDRLPHEIRVYVLSYLRPKELVRVSRVSRAFHRFCFDGQLWAFLDASEFYQEIPAESLARIIVTAGPFVKNLNLRGCVQVEHYKRTEAIVKSCKNLMHATLQDCRTMHKSTLHMLLRNNQKLVHLNLNGVSAVSNTSCKIISENCPHLEMLDVSWCDKVEANGLKNIIEACSKLRDLRAGEVRGFDNIAAAEAIFNTNNLERLVLRGCAELTDDALKVMIHGRDPELDILTELPNVPPRKLRHLDLSRCTRLTDNGVKAMGHLTPNLEGLQLSGCKSLTNSALEPVLASTPRLTHLELEDLDELSNSLLSEHLAKAPCATTLEHLSLSHCENIGDVGVLPIMQKCTALRSIDLDNTRISDLVLAEAAYMVNKRSTRVLKSGVRPKVTLQMAVYDCQNVTWTGVREVLFRNAQIRPAPGHTGQVTYPVETIALKCFYGFQMTVDEHQKRVLRGELDAANEEAGLGGAGYRRRRRRAREARALHADEEDGPDGRRRARTIGSCTVM